MSGLLKFSDLLLCVDTLPKLFSSLKNFKKYCGFITRLQSLNTDCDFLISPPL